MTITVEQRAEVALLRETTSQTLRPISPGMEARLHSFHEVLDHGFVRVVDYMGNDAAIVQAARVSYGSGTKSARDDAGLISYLMRHWHSTPMEMCEIKLHIKLPIFVARQWIRHRTANVNEYSARYSIMEREFYIPAPEHLAAQSSINNQGRGAVLEGEEAARVLRILTDDANRAYDNYEDMLSTDGQQGLARELARMNLPTSVYTVFYWKIDLHNLFHFLRLRADPHAQYEIRAYADVICDIVKDWVPAAYAAFVEHRLGAMNFSAKEIKALGAMLSGAEADLAAFSKGERQEFLAKIEKVRAAD
jgi:thymidylate synthase (FAD)